MAGAAVLVAELVLVPILPFPPLVIAPISSENPGGACAACTLPELNRFANRVDVEAGAINPPPPPPTGRLSSAAALERSLGLLDARIKKGYGYVPVPSITLNCDDDDADAASRVAGGPGPPGPGPNHKDSLGPDPVPPPPAPPPPGACPPHAAESGGGATAPPVEEMETLLESGGHGRGLGPSSDEELVVVLVATGSVLFTVTLALSSAKASQKALCVIKLSLLEKRVPQSQRYSLVPQVLEWAFQSD